MGSPVARKDFVDLYGGALYSKSVRACRAAKYDQSVMEDLVHDMIIFVYENLPRYFDECTEKSSLSGSVTSSQEADGESQIQRKAFREWLSDELRRYLERIRKQGKYRSSKIDFGKIEEEISTPSAFSVEDPDVIKGSDQQKLMIARQQCSAEQWEYFELRMRGWTYAEIAEKSGKKDAAIRQSVSRVRKFISQALDLQLLNDGESHQQ